MLASRRTHIFALLEFSWKRGRRLDEDELPNYSVHTYLDT